MVSTELWLDEWIKEKISFEQKGPLTRAAIADYQLKKLNETLSLVTQKSSFYRERLGDFGQIKDLKDIEKLPFTTANDLRESGMKMLCRRPDEISRIVTLDTSGTEGAPKRIYYTEADQELTVDFFCHGMKNLVSETDTVLILMPCRIPGSVGDLLHKGLLRLGAKSVPYGLPGQKHKEGGNKATEGALIDPQVIREILELMRCEGVTSAVGIPMQVAKIASYINGEHEEIKKNMRTVLLSAAYVSQESIDAIRNAWACEVFEHYGMTEMGLGGAVSCTMLEGYHPREADLYFEIIDPKTGAVLPDGVWGEVVFTTLTRTGMPFVRYRTGDTSRWIKEPCSCGSALKRLDKVKRGKFDVNNF